MAERVALVAVHDEGRRFATGHTRSLRLTGRQPAGSTRWEEWTIRADSTYDEGQGNDFLLGVNLRATGLLVGASAAELSGDGQTFDCSAAGGHAITIDLYGQLGQAVPTRGTRTPSGSDQRPVNSAIDNARVYSVVVGTDGYLLPGAQVADYISTLRPPDGEPSAGYQPRYTSTDEVETILRAAKNQAAGFEANFGERVITAIETAELGMDAKLGRSFGAAARATRTFLSTSRTILQVDDFVNNPAVPIVVTTSAGVADNDNIVLGGPFSARNVYSHLRATGAWLAKDEYVSVAADYGFPVPADVRNYAGKYAADILRSDAMRGGLLEADGAMAYGRTPGKDMFYYLGHYRRRRGM